MLKIGHDFPIDGQRKRKALDSFHSLWNMEIVSTKWALTKSLNEPRAALIVLDPSGYDPDQARVTGQMFDGKEGDALIARRCLPRRDRRFNPRFIAGGKSEEHRMLIGSETVGRHVVQAIYTSHVNVP